MGSHTFNVSYHFCHFQYSTYFDEESKGGIAKWKESDETWFIPKLDLAGNNIKPIITSVEGAFRPVSDYTKFKKKRDPNPRWREDNVINLDLDVLEKVSQSYNGPASESSVTQYLNMDIEDEDEQITVHNFDVPGNPYMKYTEVSL